MNTTRHNRDNGAAVLTGRSQYRGVPGKMAVAFLMLALMAVINPFTVQAARERYVLDFNDVQIRGNGCEPATIFLRKAFREQYPWVELADMDLRKVVLVAKSKRGKGGAQLRVGEWLTENYTVAGRSVDFRDRRKITFDKVQFHNPSPGSHGAWQIDLRGNFIVRKVVLELENYRWRDRYYGRKHHYNTHRFDSRYYSGR